MNKQKTDELKSCAQEIHKYLKTDIRHNKEILPSPLIVEIAGHPSCGKSTIIGKLDTSLRRLGFRVGLIQEGAQRIRNINRSEPEYNKATAEYSLDKLHRVRANTSLDIVIFERCVFDACVWPEYWMKKGMLKYSEACVLQNYYLSYADKIDVAFFVVCDSVLAVKRESKILSINQERGGTTNPQTIETLKNLFEDLFKRLQANKFSQLHFVDTTSLAEQEMVDLVTEIVITKLAEKCRNSS